MRLAPPKLQPVVPEPQETELLASAEPECLDVSEVAREGGGVRLPPPKLMPVGELAEYAQFKHDAQADLRTRRGRHFVDGDTHTGLLRKHLMSWLRMTYGTRALRASW